MLYLVIGVLFSLLVTVAVSETYKSCSAQSDIESDRYTDMCHASDDEITDGVTEEDSDDADVASAVENCNMPDHCNSAITTV